jgi:hypothetical protein
MGIALFFSHYARFTQNEIFLDYSFELIEKIQNRINQNTTLSYGQGLTGIGSAIEYLIQNGYFVADTDDILEEFDKRIFSPFNLPYLSMEELCGVGYYSAWRLSSNSIRKETIMKTVLPDVISFMEERYNSLSITYPTVSVLKNMIASKNRITVQEHFATRDTIQQFYKKHPHGIETDTYNHFLEQFSVNRSFGKITFDLGLKNGLAGFGMSLMTGLDGCNSWISLFPNDLNHLYDESLPV